MGVLYPGGLDAVLAAQAAFAVIAVLGYIIVRRREETRNGRPDTKRIFGRDGERDDARIVPNRRRAAMTAVLMIIGRGVLHAGDQLLVHRYDGAFMSWPP